MKKLRELVSDTLVYGISSVLARFINYLLVPLHTGVFSTSEYGVVSLVFVSIAFLNVVFTFGMESSYLRYAKDRDKAKDVFTTTQLGLGGLASALVLILVLAAPVLIPFMNLEGGDESLFWMMLGILWFDTMALVPFAELRLVRKSWWFAGIRTVNVGINLGLNLYLILWLNWGIEAVFFANLVASVFSLLATSALTWHMYAGQWKRQLLDKALRFGLPFVPAGIGYAINEMLDRYLLEYYLSDDTIIQLYGSGLTQTDIVGIYSACYKLSVFMLLLVQMFRMAWQPFFLQHSDDDDAKSLYRDVFLYFNVVAGIFFLAVALFAEEIVQIKVPLMDAYIIGQDHWMGLTIVPFLLGAYWFQGWYMNFSAGIFIEEVTAVLPKITLAGALITIVGNLMLIPFFGMEGSAIATLISYASMAFMLYKKSVSVYPISYQIGRALSMMIFAAALMLIQPLVSTWVGSEWISGLMLLALGIAGLFVISGKNLKNILLLISPGNPQ